jgi:lantibiotic modifying enzyme
MFVDKIQQEIIVKDIALRMQDPLHVQQQVILSLNQSQLKGTIPWASLSHGYSGVLLLFTTLDKLNEKEGWDKYAHNYVLAIKEVVEAQGVGDCSLFGGLAGVCFAIEQASRGGTRYLKLLTSLNSLLIQRTRNELLVPLKEAIFHGSPVQPDLYDVVSGISGIGLHALQSTVFPEIKGLLEEILQACIALTNKIDVKQYKVPGWYVPQDFQFTDDKKSAYPNGAFDVGVAHGAAGLLSFLSISALQGVVIEGQLQAIQVLKDWIISKRKTYQGQFYWMDRVAFEEEVGEEKFPTGYMMDAWCYGSAGVSRAIYLAGKALQDSSVQKIALKSFFSIFTRVWQDSTLLNPTFCHGVAGLLTITRLMQRDTCNEQLKEIVKKLEDRLSGLYNPDYSFGFRNLEPRMNDRELKESAKETAEFIEVDTAGLLVGATGVLLSLLELPKTQTSWILPFSISNSC